MSEVPSAPTVSIHLLDSTFERPTKTWRFDEKTAISIGRADDCDVEITDPYVSRLHALLEYADGKWKLLSKGRNGVLVHNRPVEEFAVESDTIFRLGPNGPGLKFQLSAFEAESSRTLCFDTLPVGFLGIDRRKVENEVESIAQGDYFQTLKEKAELLRRQRS